MIKCKELNTDFATKSELIASLVENKQLAIQNKKSEVVTRKYCSVRVVGKDDTIKADQSGEIGYGSVIYPVINTTNYLDSHGDVHAKGIWNKSAKEQNGKVYYIINHDLAIGSVIAQPKDVSIEVRSMSWKDLGRDYSGNTEALIYAVTLRDYANKDFITAVKAGFPLENSIRMRYIDLELCVNEKQYESEYLMWNKYISEVVNRKEAEELGYFWYVKEAAIMHEGSAVLFGSNDVTPILTEKQENIEPSGDTQINKEEGVKKAPVWLNLM